MVLPRPARAGAQVVLEIGVTAAHLANALERSLGQRRTPEIRVHDDAGRIQRPPQARRAGRLELVAKPRLEVSRIRSRLDLLARAREDNPCRIHGQRVVLSPCQLVDRGEVAEPHCASAFLGSIGISEQLAS